MIRNFNIFCIRRQNSRFLIPNLTSVINRFSDIVDFTRMLKIIFCSISDILTHFANFEFCLTAVREKRPRIFKDSFLITANKSLQEFFQLGLGNKQMIMKITYSKFSIFFNLPFDETSWIL